MNGYEKRTQQKRDAILTASQGLLFERGIKDTSIAEIAKKAKVSQVTIYNYFGSKKRLFQEVMEKFIIDGIEASEKILAEDIPFEEKIARIFTLGDNYSSLFSKGFLDSFAWEDPDMQRLYGAIAENRALPFMQRFVEHGKAEGVIHPSITSEAFMAYLSAVTSLFTQPDFLKTSEEYKWAIHRLFYYGLIGK